MLLDKVRLECPESVKTTASKKGPEITQKTNLYMHTWPSGQLGSKNVGTVWQVVSISEYRERGRILVSAVLAEDRPGRKKKWYHGSVMDTRYQIPLKGEGMHSLSSS